MTQKPDLPLNLYQVLEEEYESLHGPMPDETEAHMPRPNGAASSPAPVTSRRDWDFHAGHIKSPRAFAGLLLGGDPAPHSAMRTPTPGADGQRVATLPERLLWNLQRSLATKVGDNEVMPTEAEARAALKGIADTPAGEQILCDALNVALADQELYGEVSGRRLVAGKERFTYDQLSDATRGLLSLRESGVEFGPEEIRQFNRHLLEDAFPDAFYKVSDVRLAAVYARLHQRGQGALSLSGGGIRSGTFALGVMQGLARHRLLEKFDYLSTVSGGGYTGGWLTAWIHRHPEGLAGVSRDLADGGGDRIDPDAAPLRYLRRNSNFITPKVGLLTADTWTFIGIYLRNTFLNWLVFVPLILSALMIPRLLLALTLMQPERGSRKALFIFPWPPAEHGWVAFHWRHAFLALGVLLGSWALAYVIFNRPGLRAVLEERRPWFRGKTGQGGFLLLCLLPLLVSAFCLTTYYAWSREANEGVTKPVWDFWVFGLAFTFLGWFIASFVLKRLARPGETNLKELFGLLSVGVLGGTLFYALAQTPLSSPVLGYDLPPDWWTTPRGWFEWSTEVYVCAAVPLFLLVFLLATIVFIGVTSTHRFKFVADEDREWWARFGAWLLISLIVWVAANGLVIYGPIALLALPTTLGALGGVSGLFTLLGGGSSKTPAAEGAAEAQQGLLSKITGSLLPLLALIFVAFLVVLFSLATTGLIQALAMLAPWLSAKLSWFNPEWLTNVSVKNPAYAALVPPEAKWPEHVVYRLFIRDGIRQPTYAGGAQLAHMNVLHHTWTWFVLALGLLLLGFGIALARVINLNIFSLHGGYRNRLIRAFLGASRPERERRPNPFTGFDPADNLHMHELRPGLLDEGDFLRPEVIAAELKAAIKGEPPKTPKGAPAPPPETAALMASVSCYLVREDEGNERRAERLKHARQVLRDFSEDAPATQGLIADLRADLNSILRTDSLYKEEFAQNLLAGRALALANAIKRSQGLQDSDPLALVDKAKLRTDYHILLNRLILEAAYPGAFKPSKYPPPPYKLMHVVNTTLNLVGGNNLAWQQRKAEPFSISPLHSGCFRVGYRNSRDYGGRASNGISLGSAATASGAAASSNMGYYTTSPLISLLLTFFNVRLGIWLGNPGPHGQQTYQLSSPTLSFKPVLSEAFGLTDDTNPYVYLTDGGHFENLGFYEMVLRRCHFIVVSDAAADEQFRFGDLGNAVRKIRIDLGVPIDFWDMDIQREAPPPEQGRGVYWALARIRYTCVDKGPEARDGVLLYIKPTVYGDEPRDVLEYKKSFPAFPHQSTADQFFDEPQFESYRALGSHIMDRICGDDREGLELKQLVARAFEGLKAAKPADAKPPFALDAELVEWMRRWRRDSGME